MGNYRKILSRYFAILEENETAQYLDCKRIAVDFNKCASIQSLWKKHDSALKKMKVHDATPKLSLLDLKIELANRIFQDCILCERRCRIDRRKSAGNCGVKEARIASEFMHIGEERVLIPSYTIFFSGCTFHCVFCQNWDISQQTCGVTIKPDLVATAITKRKNEGARNVNWVGGDPTSNLPYILNVLKNCEENIPQVWNSNMYCSKETMKLLKGVIDVYLTDFKYGNNDCAKRLSRVDDYCKIVKRNHVISYKQGELIIRHLVLPNHTTCCSEPIIKWIKNNIPEVVVNVMAQYRPEYHADNYEDITRHITTEEYIHVKKYANSLDIHVL